jgi:hypothetical protein
MVAAREACWAEPVSLAMRDRPLFCSPSAAHKERALLPPSLPSRPRKRPLGPSRVGALPLPAVAAERPGSRCRGAGQNQPPGSGAARGRLRCSMRPPASEPGRMNGPSRYTSHTRRTRPSGPAPALHASRVAIRALRSPGTSLPILLPWFRTFPAAAAMACAPSKCWYPATPTPPKPKPPSSAAWTK